jgi:ribosomal protein S18 acetylase RimI-like enzyme
MMPNHTLQRLTRPRRRVAGSPAGAGLDRCRFMHPELQVSLSVHDELPREFSCVVDTGLGESNGLAAPLHEVQPLSAFARLTTGEVIGGAIGRTWGACCELQQLWVNPQHRRRGLGARLVREFEARAEARGCTTFYLETFSFQSPSLYRSLGYEVALELEGFSPGVVRYTMVRHLAQGGRH